MGTYLIATGKSKKTKRTAPKLDDKIAMLVGSVTDDTRVYEVSATKITALRFTKTARA
ncbi:hypothetical protein MKW92_040470 [Papaver armeniacum]|nr:hypothetical protein MKW92_040470 [Papaver armeniacum]